MKDNKNNEKDLASYADQIEEPKAQNLSDMHLDAVGNGELIDQLRADATAKATALNEYTNEEEHADRVKQLQEFNRTAGHGFLPIKVEDLPTKGLYYPVGTRINIKAATLADIKHWSSTDETDPQSIDTALNNILESCCYVSFPQDEGRYATYKDLIDIDRFYIILAIHDFTFPAGKNDLKVVINEKDEVTVKKDNVEFLKLSDKFMKYYNAEKRCFSFPVKSSYYKSGMMDIYMPSVGTIKWLKDYMYTRQQRREGFDQDFINIAAFLVSDYRFLNNDYYYQLVDMTTEWTSYEWALMTKVRSTIESAIVPVLNYTDEGGTQRQAPLEFRGGIKSIFMEHIDIDF